MSDLDDIRPTLPAPGTFDPTEVVLIGVAMSNEPAGSGQIPVASELTSKLTLACEPVDGVTVTLAVIYSYGYEGHMYKLDQPKIMAVSGKGEAIPGEESGSPLLAWRLTKETTTVCISVDVGEVKEIVLAANQPGQSSAVSYHSHMQMSHRGGRLT